MDVKLSVLADAANLTNDGKLNILGVLSQINTFQVPIQYPHMAVVLQLTATPGERGTSHALKLVIVDEDGKPVVPPSEMKFVVPDNLPGPDVDLNIIAGMVGLQLMRFGDYRVDVLIDGQSKAQLRFKVQAVQPPPGMSLPPPPQE